MVKSFNIALSIAFFGIASHSIVNASETTVAKPLHPTVERLRSNGALPAPKKRLTPHQKLIIEQGEPAPQPQSISVTTEETNNGYTPALDLHIRLSQISRPEPVPLKNSLGRTHSYSSGLCNLLSQFAEESDAAVPGTEEPPERSHNGLRKLSEEDIFKPN